MDCNSNTQKSDADNLPDLPWDVMVDIVSRLPLKLIIGCTFLSKALSHLISTPSFSRIYQTKNKSNYFSTIFVDDSKPHVSLLEFDHQRDFCEISKGTIFNLDRLPGLSVSACIHFSMFGYCNGLFSALKKEFDLHTFFLINPLLGEFIQLPGPIDAGILNFLTCGLGYCQFTNRYKVLKIVSSMPGIDYKSNTQIFTVGSDQNWRTVSAAHVPYKFGPNPHEHMVPFHSALHWIVHPVPMYETKQPVIQWGSPKYICAFDLTEEKATLVPFPPGVGDIPRLRGSLSVLFDKLSVWHIRQYQGIDLWVMDDYGVQGSWTKLFVLNWSTLPNDILHDILMPVTVSPEGVIMLSDLGDVLFYDLKKEKCLMVVHRKKGFTLSYPFPFVPNFVSLRNLLQGV